VEGQSVEGTGSGEADEAEGVGAISLFGFDLLQSLLVYTIRRWR
jgi:hypothetical protein